MNDLEFAFSKALKIKKEKEILLMDKAYQLLKDGLLAKKHFCDGYNGDSVKSERRLYNFYSNLGKILELFDKRDILCEGSAKQTELKVEYNGAYTYNNLYNAQVNYTPDITYRESYLPRTARHCVEVRAQERDIDKNKHNNLTNILGRRQQYNAIISRNCGLLNRDFFSAAHLINVDSLTDKQMKRGIEFYLSAYELHGLNIAIIIYKYEGDSVILRNDLIPDVCKIERIFV